MFQITLPPCSHHIQIFIIVLVIISGTLIFHIYIVITYFKNHLHLWQCQIICLLEVIIHRMPYINTNLPWVTMSTYYMNHHHRICQDQIVLLFYNYSLLLLIDIHLSWEICIYSNWQNYIINITPIISILYIQYYIYMYIMSGTWLHFILSSFICHLLIFPKYDYTVQISSY